MKNVIAILLTAAALMAQSPKMFTSYTEQSNGDFLAIAELQDASTVGGIQHVRLIYTNTKAFDIQNGYADLYCYRASSIAEDVWCYFLNNTGPVGGQWQGPYRLGSPTPAVVGPTMTWKPAQSAFYVDPVDAKKGRIVLALSAIPGGPRVAFAWGVNASGQFSYTVRLTPPCAIGEYDIGCQGGR